MMIYVYIYMYMMIGLVITDFQDMFQTNVVLLGMLFFGPACLKNPLLPGTVRMGLQTQSPGIVDAALDQDCPEKTNDEP